MDLKKEIKLSDLVRRPVRARTPGTRAFPETETRSKRSGRLSRKAHQEVIGLKIGASQLAASRVSNNGSPMLLQLVREPLAPGIVSRGEVKDIPALAAALDAFFATYSLPRRNVRLGVATNRIGVRAFEMAGVDDDRQLSNAVRFRAQEEVSIPTDEAVLDYHVVNETVDESGAVSRRIVLVAADRQSIDRYTAACKEAHIQLVGIDLEPFALLRAVAPPPSEAEADDRRAATIAVTIGHDRTTLAISDGIVCEFTRVIEWGGSALTSAIERSLHVNKDEAEELKLAMTFDPDPGDDRTRLAGEAVRREIQTLARDLVASLQFYQSQPESLAIGDVLIAGGVTRMPGFLEELARVTRVGVRRADPLARVAVAEDVEAGEDLPSFAVAIGLGVDD
jgi:type IV pilus assembly protein PilM